MKANLHGRMEWFRITLNNNSNNKKVSEDRKRLARERRNFANVRGKGRKPCCCSVVVYKLKQIKKRDNKVILLTYP